MAVSFSTGRSSRARASVREVLPKNVRSLASRLSDDDSEVLHYLVLFGCHVQQVAGAFSSASNKSIWKPWKNSASKSSDGGLRQLQQQQQSCGSSAAAWKCCCSSTVYGHKPSFSCYCFFCYASFWSRWDKSEDKNLINEILEVVELQEDGASANKAKKKKKHDKKQILSEKETSCSDGGCIKNNNEGNRLSSSHIEEYVNLRDSEGKRMVVETTAEEENLISTSDICIGTSTEKAIKETQNGAQGTGTLLAEMKYKLHNTDSFDDACSTQSSYGTPRNSEFMELDALPRASNASRSSSNSNLLESAKDSEVDGFFSTCASVPLSSGKVSPKLHLQQRTGKRKSSQIIPFDCENSMILSQEDQGGDSSCSVDSTDNHVPARVADNSLSSTGFFARVFPDALGGFASRLWDALSLRTKSRTVEYNI